MDAKSLLLNNRNVSYEVVLIRFGILRYQFSVHLIALCLVCHCLWLGLYSFIKQSLLFSLIGLALFTS